jgi:hypothetical protein
MTRFTGCCSADYTLLLLCCDDLQVTRTLRLLTGEPSVLPAIKESGAIGQLVRILKHCERTS